MSKAPLIFLGVLVALAGGRYLWGTLNKPDDAQMIKTALAEAIEASREGRPGSVVELLSNKFSFNDQQPGARQVADLVKRSKPEVKLSNENPQINGDRAEIVSDVQLTTNILNNKQSLSFQNVKLVFAKETGTDLLIFPATKWKLRDVQVDDSQIPSFGGMSPF